MKKITLSFDNGPDARHTPGVLDILRDYDIKASFFFIGDKLKDPANFAVAERAHAEGHWLGSHTMTHSLQLGESNDPQLPDFEIGQAHALLRGLGHQDKLFRPFGGFGKLTPDLLSQYAVDYLLKNNFTCVIWNNVPRDWEDEDNWDAVALEQAAELDWSLLVTHDFLEKAPARLPIFLEQVRKNSWEITQEFPEECILTAAGRPQTKFDHLVTEV